jgi:hypothetical protein
MSHPFGKLFEEEFGLRQADRWLTVRTPKSDELSLA